MFVAQDTYHEENLELNMPSMSMIRSVHKISFHAKILGLGPWMSKSCVFTPVIHKYAG